jgi:SAM-dependent methyltransferase
MADARTIALYDAKAADYAKLVQSDAADAQLQAFMDLLPKGAGVLDLGCGPAFASVKMRDAGFKPDPVDASKGMVDMANARFDINARQLTFDDIDMIAAYDGVWANFSLLHAARADLPRHLAALATALRLNGIIHIGMKTGTGEARDRIDRKYTYVTKDELRELLETAGFTRIGIDTGADAGFDGTVAPWVVMRGRKHG